MPKFAPWLAPGFDLGDQTQMIELARILLLSPILLGLSNLLGSVTQTYRKFFIYSLSPIFYNLDIMRRKNLPQKIPQPKHRLVKIIIRVTLISKLSQLFSIINKQLINLPKLRIFLWLIKQRNKLRNIQQLIQRLQLCLNFLQRTF